MNNISVGISTVFDNIDRAKALGLSILKNDSLGVIKEVLIVCQRSSSAFLDNGVERLRVFGVTESGLSKSRNFVLRSATGDFVWFLDDDVVVTRESLEEIAQLGQGLDVVLGWIGCANGPGLYKNYDRRSFLPFSLLRVSSVELIVNRRKIHERGVYFDERLGLGGKYPCGEENAFLIDLYRSGAKFEQINKVIVYHPCGDGVERDYFKSESQMFARGIVAGKFGFFVGFSLCCYWSLRTFKKSSSFKLVRSLFNGFLNH